MENGNKLVLYTQTAITTVIILVWMFLIITGRPSPALFDTVVGVIIGAYFTRNGKLLQEQSARLFRKKKDNNE